MENALDVLTLLEAAALLHCSKTHICNLVNGKVRGVPPIPAISLGRRKLIRRGSLCAWIGANENPCIRANSDAKMAPSRNADLRERA